MLGCLGLPVLFHRPPVLGVRHRPVVQAPRQPCRGFQLDPLAPGDIDKDLAHPVVVQVAALRDLEPFAMLQPAPVDDDVHVRMRPVGVERRVVVVAVAAVLAGPEHLLGPGPPRALGRRHGARPAES